MTSTEPLLGGGGSGESTFTTLRPVTHSLPLYPSRHHQRRRPYYPSGWRPPYRPWYAPGVYSWNDRMVPYVVAETTTTVEDKKEDEPQKPDTNTLYLSAAIGSLALVLLVLGGVWLFKRK